MMPEEPKPHVRVIDSLWTFAVAVAFIGPLALPLFWRNPRFTRKTKTWVTLGVIILTIGLLVLAAYLPTMILGEMIDLES
jgi:hypothetical protein